jgi:translation initiation factor IF-1
MDARTCKSGFVWREAYPGDFVCVEPSQRDQAAADNAAASSRVNPGGAYGPHTCISGFVWREAGPGDVVCVEPWVRSRVADDNRKASARVQGGATLFD